MAGVPDRADAVLGEEPDREEEEADPAQPADRPLDLVDQLVAEDRQHRADRRDQCGGHRGADAPPGRQCGAAEHGAGREEAHIHDHDQDQRDDRTVEAELRPALDHLRDAQLRPLGRVQRHEHRADQVAERDGRDRPGQRQAQDHPERAGDHRGDLHVRREPDREQTRRTAVALVLGYLVDRSLLHGQGCRVLHGPPRSDRRSGPAAGARGRPRGLVGRGYEPPMEGISHTHSRCARGCMASFRYGRGSRGTGEVRKCGCRRPRAVSGRAAAEPCRGVRPVSGRP